MIVNTQNKTITWTNIYNLGVFACERYVIQSNEGKETLSLELKDVYTHEKEINALYDE